jgi:hypothetical protein
MSFEPFPLSFPILLYKKEKGDRDMECLVCHDGDRPLTKTHTPHFPGSRMAHHAHRTLFLPSGTEPVPELRRFALGE